jgi:type 2 lantibiotic biosynthesis protein LanM
VEQFPYLAKVIAAERADLQTGDIPLFTTRPVAHDLWSSANQRIAEFFDEPGMALAQRRLQRLSDADLAQQLWIIRASLATLATNDERVQPSTRQVALSQPHPQPIQTQNERLLAAACAVGDRLETLALRGEQNVSWLGMVLESDHAWSLMPLGIDLYGGLPGVALFLAYLGAVTQTERYTELAQAATDTLRRQMERSEYITLLGGFSGWGGVIYTLAHLGVLWQQPALLTEAERLVERLPGLVEQDDQFDVISGAAGCIGGLLALHRCAPSERTLAAAIQCGDHLLNRAQPQRQGIGWFSALARQPLAGMAHGAAGIAWALFELAAVSGIGRFRTAACAALAYERSLFSAPAGNWPDLRIRKGTDQSAEADEPHFMTAWCHGAAGIGLARLRTLSSLNDSHTAAEINMALQTTLANGFGHNHSLCHGDLGNLELLLQASETFAPQWRCEVKRQADLILDQITQDGWRCGLPLGVESPGLMTGLAGIGYGLLRLAAPGRVPSVLVLAPPV